MSLWSSQGMPIMKPDLHGDGNILALLGVLAGLTP